jgi:hypothetical protein
MLWDVGNSIMQPKLDFPDNGGKHGPKLQVCKLIITGVGEVLPENNSEAHLLTNASMTTSTEGLVWTLSPLADSTETIINFLAMLVGVFLGRLRSNTLRITPPSRVPLRGVRPDKRVNLADRSRSEYVITLRDNICAIFGGRSEGRRNRDIRTDIAHEAMDRWMQAEGFTNNGIKDWELTEAFISHRTESTIGIAEVVDLLLVKGIPIVGQLRQVCCYDRGTLTGLRRC